MHALLSRAGRQPLALAFVFVGACADDTTAPKFSLPLRPNAALGDVYTVTTPYDNGAIGSLRWALKFSTGGETIRFDPSLAGQTVFVDSTIYIQRSVTIEGPANGRVTISGGRKARMFRASFTGYVTFRNLSITDAYSPAGVGAVIFGDADVTLENTTLYGNDADAGVAVLGNNITLVNSTVTGTVNANGATYDYPALMGNTVALINSTVAYNGWGGVGSFSGAVRLRNSIVSNNVGKNCVKTSNTTITREGANISDDDTCGGPGEITIVDPKLAPLADNGGPSMTHALLTGSPAINTAAGCSVTVDQRYFPRDAQCDLGAFEFADFTTVTITIDPTTIIKNSTGWAVLTGTVTCSRNETFQLALELAQQQKKGGEVHSAATVPVQCATTPRMWSASMALTEGEFQPGTATAEAFTLNTEKWVTPAQASGSVKLFRSR